MADPGPSRTDWTRIRGGDFDFFVRRYWSPVQRFLAQRLPTEEEAEDVTQELFVTFLQKDFLGRADDQQGSFRNFLFHAARQFLIDRYRRRSAKKRGGDARIVSIDAVGDIPDAPEAFDQEWYLSLFNQARRGVKEHYRERGRPEVYRAFRLFHFGDGGPEPWSQKRIAEDLGVNLQSVKNFVHRAKDVFSRQIRAAIAEYTRTDEELEAELQDLARYLEEHRLMGPPPSTFLGPAPADEPETLEG